MTISELKTVYAVVDDRDPVRGIERESKGKIMGLYDEQEDAWTAYFDFKKHSGCTKLNVVPLSVIPPKESQS